jgi:adenine deaminase
MVQITANIVDIINRRIFPGTVIVDDGKIIQITKDETIKTDNYILPGFIDAHVHIESSMLVPSEFARMAVVHGTVATVSDPHEIANVLGIDGIKFMIENGNKVPFKFYFGAPSCVPATTFETSGAAISANDIRTLFEKYELKYLSEMMNFPGVLNDFPDVIEKIKVAKEFGLPIDGHAPGLKGEPLRKYITAGISTDHECFELNEAIDKIYNGMKILIREGSAAKNFDTLYKLVDARPDMCMFCSDDKHPDDLAVGHINELVKRSIERGSNLFNVLRIATLNPVLHYNLDVGLLREGDDADFIVVDNLKDFNVLKTYIKGQLVAEAGRASIDSVHSEQPNNFKAEKKNINDFRIEPKGKKLRVIEALDGQLITNEIYAEEKIKNSNLVSDVENDILKIAVVNRYQNLKPALGFIKNFGLIRGAIASSVGHDSHNIIAVGTNDDELCRAINSVIESKGGMAVVEGNKIDTLPLPVAGLMSVDDGYSVANNYSILSKRAKELGSNLNAPFMTLSFMALLVIPQLKLSDKGLFDGNKFEFVDLHT